MLQTAQSALGVCARVGIRRALYYLCVYGTRDKRDPAGDPSAAQTLLGIRRVPPHAGADHPLGARRTRHARPDAHRRRQIPHLSNSGPRAGGNRRSRNPSDRPDERPGGPAAGAENPGRGDPLGNEPPPDRHRAGQLRVRRRQISLRRPRAAGHRSVPPARAAHAGHPAGRGRGALHLAVGL